MRRTVILLASTIALAACAPAQMRLPATLADGSSRVEFTGISGWDRGQFTAGSFSGRFQRSLERLSFAPLVERFGRGDFVIAGPEIASPIEARCDMRERALDFGLAEVTVEPMAYGCDFVAEGRPLAASFEMHEVVGGGTAITRYERRGEIDFGGQVIQFRSAHHIAESSLPTLDRIGYVFEQRGRPIGALELTGRPALILAPDLDPGVARTLTVAALALAIFWDPAVHGPDA